jgi:hypothetical protein
MRFAYGKLSAFRMAAARTKERLRPERGGPIEAAEFDSPVIEGSCDPDTNASSRAAFHA